MSDRRWLYMYYFRIYSHGSSSGTYNRRRSDVCTVQATRGHNLPPKMHQPRHSTFLQMWWAFETRWNGRQQGCDVVSENAQFLHMN